jgi:hypothetical protein
MTELSFNQQNLSSQIHFIRGQKVMLDFDLAQIYGIETKFLKRAVRKNSERFPPDFMFELTQVEYNNLIINMRYQFGTSHSQSTRYAPFAFTEHGAVMLASVLNSPTAVQASILVVRAFIQLRNVLESHKELAEKINELEYNGEYDKIPFLKRKVILL